MPGAAFGPGRSGSPTTDVTSSPPAAGGTVTVWDVATWKRGAALGERRRSGAAGPFGVPLATPSDIVRLAPSPDGRLIAAISLEPITGADGILAVHDIDGGPDGFEVDVGRRVSDADWSTDGELLAIAGVDRDDVATVTVADRAGRLLTTLRFPGHARRDRTIHRRR